MAKQIKYKTVLSSLTKGGKPCYIVKVVNNGTEYLMDSAQMKKIAALINMSVPFAKSTSEIVLKKAIELALEGKRVETEMFSMYLTGRGGCSGTNEKWDPARHSLHLAINLKGELKKKLDEVQFVNVTEDIKVTLYSAGDEIYAQDGVLAGTAGFASGETMFAPSMPTTPPPSGTYDVTMRCTRGTGEPGEFETITIPNVRIVVP